MHVYGSNFTIAVVVALFHVVTPCYEDSEGAAETMMDEDLSERTAVESSMEPSENAFDNVNMSELWDN